MIPEKIPDKKIEEILKLSAEQELNQGEIAEQVGVSRATVGKYIREVRKISRDSLRPKISIQLKVYLKDTDLRVLSRVLAPMVLQQLEKEQRRKKKPIP